MPKACPYKSVKALLWNDDIFMHRNSGLTQNKSLCIDDGATMMGALCIAPVQGEHPQMDDGATVVGAQ